MAEFEGVAPKMVTPLDSGNLLKGKGDDTSKKGGTISYALDDWKDKIYAAEKFHHEEFEKKVDRFIGYYQGEFFKDTTGRYGNSAVGSSQYNMTWTYINTLKASLYYRNPEVIVTPRPKTEKEIESLEQGSRILQSSFPWVFHVGKLKIHARHALLDSLITGIGWIKVMWNKERNLPENVRVSSFDVLYPPVTQGLFLPDLVPYFIHRIQKPLLEVQRDKRYKNTESLRGEEKIKYRPKVAREQKYLADEDLVTIYEIHVRDGNKIMTYCQDRWLRDPFDNPDDIRWSRFKPLVFFYNSDTTIPIPLPKIFEPQQIEKNLVRSQMAQHRARNNRRYTVKKGAMDRSDMMKFEDNVDMSLFEIKDNPDFIKPLQDMPLSMDVYRIDETLDRDGIKITAITDQEQGLQSAKEQTATETTTLNVNAHIRQSEMQDLIEEWLEDIAETDADLMMQYWNEDMFTKISGIPGWHRFKKEDILGEYLFEIVVGSTTPKDRETLKKNFLQMFQLALQAKQEIPQLNLVPIFEKLMELFDISRVEEILPAPPPVLAPPVPPAAIGGNGGAPLPLPPAGAGPAFPPVPGGGGMRLPIGRGI